MGRKTWEAIPADKRPLPGRLNVVLSSQPENEIFSSVSEDKKAFVQKFNNYEQAMDSISQNPIVNEVYLIGGSSLFDIALKQYPEHTKIIIETRINQVFECDVYMEPQNKEYFVPLFISKTEEEKGITFDYMISGNKQLLEA